MQNINPRYSKTNNYQQFLLCVQKKCCALLISDLQFLLKSLCDERRNVADITHLPINNPLIADAGVFPNTHHYCANLYYYLCMTLDWTTKFRHGQIDNSFHLNIWIQTDEICMSYNTWFAKIRLHMQRETPWV